MKSRGRLHVILCVLLFFPAAGACADFRRGINAPKVIRLSSFLGDEDYSTIAASGFDFIRLPFEPDYLFSNSELVPSVLDALKEAIGRANSHGLTVIIDAHPSGPYKLALFKDERQQEEFRRMWVGIAAAFKDTERGLAFELLNEPGPFSAGIWWRLQDALIEEIRAVDPSRTIIVNAEKVSSVSDLIGQVPYKHSALIYNFHFYNPMVFTHQGAHWGSRKFENIRGVPWPLKSKHLSRLGVPPTRVPGLMEGRRGWQIDELNLVLQQAFLWGEHFNVPIMCNEFGVYAHGGVTPKARYQYLQDLVSIFDKMRFSWALWQYSGGFGILSSESDAERKRIDPEVLRAIGLEQ